MKERGGGGSVEGRGGGGRGGRGGAEKKNGEMSIQIKM